MKNLTALGLLTALIAVLLFGCSKEDDESNDQKYLPLLVPGKMWFECFEAPWLEDNPARVPYCNNPGLYFNQFEKIGSDTIVEGIKWYKYYQAIGDYDSITNEIYKTLDEDSANYRLHGFFHEDTDSGRVYFKAADIDGSLSTSAEKILWYDFSLDVGEEIEFYGPHDAERLYYYLWKVDSVKYFPTYHFGGKRKHIYLSRKDKRSQIMNGYVEWIEGIGSKNGLMGHRGINVESFEAGGQVLYCKEDGELIYRDFRYHVCF